MMRGLVEEVRSRSAGPGSAQTITLFSPKQCVTHNSCQLLAPPLTELTCSRLCAVTLFCLQTTARLSTLLCTAAWFKNISVMHWCDGARGGLVRAGGSAASRRTAPSGATCCASGTGRGARCPSPASGASSASSSWRCVPLGHPPLTTLHKPPLFCSKMVNIYIT